MFNMSHGITDLYNTNPVLFNILIQWVFENHW